MADPALKPLALAELDALEDQDGQRYELWDGQLVAMTGGTSAHNLIALGLRDVLRRQLPRMCKVFVADMALRLGRQNQQDQAYPDVMVISQPLLQGAMVVTEIIEVEPAESI